MEQQPESRQLIISYLLGNLAEPARSEFEQKYFADDNLFDLLRVTEDELIDAYVRGELSAPEHELFESNFLAAPAQRERVATARALLTTFGSAPAARAAGEVAVLPRAAALSINSPIN